MTFQVLSYPVPHFVCGGGFAHIAVKPVVAIGDVCANGQPIRDGIFEVDAESCIHETSMVKTFDFFEFGEISFRAKRVA